MRQVITIFILFFSITFGIKAQSIVAIISDKDGYTNVRTDASAESDIMLTIKNYEPFYFYANESNWWKIETPSKKTGYMHKSRIKPVENCDCHGYGKEFPNYIFPNNDKFIQLCGYIKEKGETIKISETRVTYCNENNILLEIDATQNGILELNKNEFIIKEIYRLPAGENWKWIDVVFFQYKFNLENENPMETSFDLNLSDISELAIEKFMLGVDNFQPKDIDEIVIHFSKLFIAFLSGNEIAKDKFLNYRKIYNISMDGYVLETYEKYLGLIEKTNKLYKL